MKITRTQILNALEIYHRTQGIAFISEESAVDYFRGLTELIETLIEESHTNHHEH